MVNDSEKMDSLIELIQIGIGKAAQVLNAMLSSHVELRVPSIAILSIEEFAQEVKDEGARSLSAVEMDFSGEISGSAQLIFETGDAGRLVDCIVAEANISGADLDSIRSGTLCEVGNIVINAILGTIANCAHLELGYSVPIYLSGQVLDLVSDVLANSEGVVIRVKAQFTVESLEVEGDICLYLSLDSMRGLERALKRFAHGG